MKSFKEFLICFGLLLFVLGGYFCIPEGHYERVVVDDVVYSEHVTTYPSSGEARLGIFLLIGGGILFFVGVSPFKKVSKGSEK